MVPSLRGGLHPGSDSPAQGGDESLEQAAPAKPDANQVDDGERPLELDARPSLR
jgi:hypothetical protein